jgi:hypothetical protein
MRLLLALLLCLRCHARVAEAIHDAGPRSISIVVVGDGYTTNQFDKFRSDATNTFKALREAFSAQDQPKIGGWWVYRPSRESGCDDPSKGIVRDTAYNSGHDQSIHRLLGPDYYGTLLALGDSAHLGLSNTVTAVIVNTTAYGGAGGMVLSASVHASSAEILRHELGHTFAGLADEYCTAYPGWRQTETPNSSSNRVNPPWIGITTNWIDGSQYNCTAWGRPFQDCRMKTLGRAWCDACESHLAKVVRLKTGPAAPGRRALTLRAVSE